MTYSRLGSVLNGIAPAELAERGFGVAGLFHCSPPRGWWHEAGEEALAAYLHPVQASALLLSWHYPVLHGSPEAVRAHPRWFSADARERQAECASFERDVAAAVRLGADHIVTHFTHYPSVQPEEALDSGLVGETLTWMADVQHRFGLPICLECFGDPYWLTIRAARHGLYLCLDSGHLVRSAQERGSRYLDDAEVMAPLVRVVHLWNTRSLPGEHHVPYHPDQRPADGWAPILALLGRILPKNPSVPILAQPSMPLHGIERFWEGLEWLGHRLNRMQGR